MERTAEQGPSGRSGLADVYAAWAARAAAEPARSALLLPEGPVSYGTLQQRVDRIRAALAPLSVRRQAVGIGTADPLTAYSGILAVLAEGGYYVPLNHRFPPERNRAVMAASGLRQVVASAGDGDVRALGQELGLNIVLPEGLPEASPEPMPAEVPEEEDLAYLLFTSGSTGVPKGVPIPHRALRHFLRTVTDPELWAVGPEDVFLQPFELTFDLSVYSFMAPMVLGAACAPVPGGGVGYLQLLDTLERHGVTVALMVPSALAYLRAYFEEIELPALRYSLFCGEALPADLATAWAARVPQAQVENVYGPTEATIFCTRYVLPAGGPADTPHGVVPIGAPMPGVEALLLDAVGHPAEEGELCLGGPQVTPGYWRNPEKNAEAFVTVGGRRYYRTGDRCQRAGGGELLYLGRTDQQVKVDGYRVELGEIEHHARRLAGTAAAVVAIERQGHTQLVLWLEGWAGAPAELLTALGQALPSYMVPARVLSLPSLPLNSNGKVDRPRLRTLAMEHPA